MPVRRMHTVLVAVVALLASALIGAGPAAQASDRTTLAARTWSVWVGSESKDMAIQGMRFLPGSITINAGDTVTWHANATEIHTVTFFKGGHPRHKLPQFDPTSKRMLNQRGGHVYSRAAYFNSGILTTVPNGGDAGPLPPNVTLYKSYSLTFPHTGTFTYYCLVHGLMMVGTIKVDPKGSKYPATQAHYTAQAKAEARSLLAEGQRLWSATRQAAGPRLVMTGNDDGAVALMRFVNRTVHVTVGKSVTWKNTGKGAPHTVTFGKEPLPPGLFGPSGHPKNFRGGNLNSGLILPGSMFKVTFKKVGTYHYVCALHDGMGMRGKVVVQR